jgi:hypothetical protein
LLRLSGIGFGFGFFHGLLSLRHFVVLGLFRSVLVFGLRSRAGRLAS